MQSRRWKRCWVYVVLHTVCEIEPYLGRYIDRTSELVMVLLDQHPYRSLVFLAICLCLDKSIGGHEQATKRTTLPGKVVHLDLLSTLLLPGGITSFLLTLHFVGEKGGTGYGHGSTALIATSAVTRIANAGLLLRRGLRKAESPGFRGASLVIAMSGPPGITLIPHCGHGESFLFLTNFLAAMFSITTPIRLAI
jgi:hypothetical protein